MSSTDPVPSPSTPAPGTAEVRRPGAPRAALWVVLALAVAGTGVVSVVPMAAPMHVVLDLLLGVVALVAVAALVARRVRRS
jgi:hypothetical protein